MNVKALPESLEDAWAEFKVDMPSYAEMYCAKFIFAWAFIKGESNGRDVEQIAELERKMSMRASRE